MFADDVLLQANTHDDLETLLNKASASHGATKDMWAPH